MKAFQSAVAVLITFALFSPALAHAHKPPIEKVKAFLQPALEEGEKGIAETLAADPASGKTIVNTRVTRCERVTQHRVDCDLEYTFKDPAGKTFDCSVRAQVRYRGKRSRRLHFVGLGDYLTCRYPIQD
jgi:hypothetical protein